MEAQKRNTSKPIKKTPKNGGNKEKLSGQNKIIDMCQSCEESINAEQIYVTYPCGHMVHLFCLYQRESIEFCVAECPICVPNIGEVCREQSEHTCLLNAYQTTTMGLNIGISLKDVLNDMKMDLVKDLCTKKYRQKVHELEDIAEKANNNFGLFKWNKSQSNKAEMGFKGDLSAMISSKENIVSLVTKRVTWTDISLASIPIDTLFESGYTVIDCMLLYASWDQLLASGLRPQLFAKYKKSIDITSIIEYYDLVQKDIYINLCERDFDTMATLGLSFQDMKRIKFTKHKCNLDGISEKTIMESKLWEVLQPQEWKELGFTVE